MKKKQYQSPEIEIARLDFEEVCGPFDWNNYLMEPSKGENPNRDYFSPSFNFQPKPKETK